MRRGNIGCDAVTESQPVAFTKPQPLAITKPQPLAIAESESIPGPNAVGCADSVANAIASAPHGNPGAWHPYANAGWRPEPRRRHRGPKR